MGRFTLSACLLLLGLAGAMPVFASDGEDSATKDAYYLGSCAWLPCAPSCVVPLGECPAPCPTQPCECEATCPPADCCAQPGVTCTKDCTPIPVVAPYCPGIDPNCPPHEDFKLLCCERSPYSLLCCQEREQFKLLCQPECQPCKVPKCKQHTCTPAEDECGSCDSWS
jgi:hypothetical protein